MFWRVQGEPEGGLSPPDLQSGQLAQPQALASLLATQRWPHPWPWKSAEQALAWGSPCLGITGNAQPGQRAAGLRKGCLTLRDFVDCGPIRSCVHYNNLIFLKFQIKDIHTFNCVSSDK